MAADGILTLARAAVVAVGDSPVVSDAQLRHGDVDVESLRALSTGDGKPLGTLVLARSPLSGPLEMEDDVVRIPSDNQRLAEAAIETLARLLAVEHRTGFSISSPLPDLGFLADDVSQLAPFVDKRVDQPPVEGRIVVKPKAGILHLDDALADRLDGVALLANALGNPNAVGRYLDFIRLFEMAFATKAGSLTQHMVPHLEGTSTPHNFTKKEIHTWVEGRPRAAHADRDDRDFYLEADVAPLVDRMEEAANDVLLNKADWRSITTTRRDAWQAVSGSAALGGASPFATVGEEFSGQLQLVNQFDGRGAEFLVAVDQRS